jgi:SNF2 family DNA or RNA helicase
VLIHKKKKAIILRLKDPERVLSVIPKAKKFLFKGKEYVAIPHRRDEVKVLNNIGINAPSPMEFYYDWPGRFKPFDAQITTAAFMAQHNRCFNLNDLGTGKTLSTLWAYDYLRSIGSVRKAIVVTPLSTLERTWADEVFNHFPHLTTAVLHGSREKRLKMLATDADLYLINHDGLKVAGMVEAINARDDIDLVIIDEVSQAARTASSDRWKSLAKIVRHQVEDGKHRLAWGLTGTPTPSNPTDAWAQCRLLVPDAVPPYFNSFKMQVMRQISQFVWVPREDAQEIVYEAMQPAIRFKRDEVVDLPPCTFVEREVELTPAQKKAYKEMLAKLQAEFDSGEVTAVNEAVKAQKLIQILCGGVYGKDGEVHHIDARPRYEAVREVCEESSSKTIVFVPFVSMVEPLKEYLEKSGFSVACIHGGVSKHERDVIFTSFQKAEDPQVLVSIAQAMSHGLTLTAASTIVWAAPITSNDIFEQANARVSRPGQKLNQLIVMIEGSPIERKYYQRLKEKGRVQGILLDMVQANRKSSAVA